MKVWICLPVTFILSKKLTPVKGTIPNAKQYFSQLIKYASQFLKSFYISISRDTHGTDNINIYNVKLYIMSFLLKMSLTKNIQYTSHEKFSSFFIHIF